MVDKSRRAAIYARISRDTAGEGRGIERQLEDCRALAARLGFVVVAEHVDNDVSAYRSRTRPGYQALMGAIAEGRIDAVLCWHTDRLHRQTKELEHYIEACEPLGVSTYAVTAGDLDLTTPSGRAVAKTRGAWAQYESEHKAERIQRQKQQAASRGEFLGGRIPWGWTRGPKGQIVVDEAAADHIREGTSAIIEGAGLIEVTRRWADAGVRSLSGTRMNTTQVKRILSRPRNAGIMTFRGSVVSADWPAIVTLEEFRTLETRLSDPSRPAQTESKYRYLLSGLVTCWCGLPMTGFGADPSPEHPKYRRSYRCTVHATGGRYVRGHAIRAAETLDAYVTKSVAAYLAREDVRTAFLSARGEDPSGPRPVDTAGLIERRQSLARLFAEGAIDEAQFVEGTALVRDKLAEAEAATKADGKSAALFAVLAAEDPKDCFLSRTTVGQREVIREVVDIRLLEGAAPGRGFQPEFVDLGWRLGTPGGQLLEPWISWLA